MKLRALAIAAAVCAASSVLAACGSGGSTTTVIKESAPPTVEKTTTVQAPAPKPKPASAPASEAEPQPEPAPKSAPNVVGLPLPAAEQVLKAAGFRPAVKNTDTAFGIVVRSHYTICIEGKPRGDLVPVLAQKYGC